MISRSLYHQELEHVFVQYDSYMNAINSHAIVAVTDKRGIITFANEAFCKISQFTLNELIGSSHRIVNSGYHPPEFFRDMWKTISSGKIWKGEVKNKAKDGSHYWMSTTIVPFFDQQGEISRYVSLRTDITQLKNLEWQLTQEKSSLETRVSEKAQKLAEVNDSLLQENIQNKKLAQELREQKEAYANLFNYASDALVIVDATDGKIIQLNEKAGSLVNLIDGISRGIIFYNGETTELPIELREMQLNKTYRELFLKDKKGQFLPVTVSVNHATWENKPVLQAIIHDMSEQKKLERQLKLEAAHNRLLEVISSEANRSTDVDSFIWTCIELICRKFSWTYGHVLRSNLENNSASVVPTNTWYQSGQADFDVPLVQATAQVIFHSNAGCVGRVFSRKRPEFILDVSRISAEEFLRKDAAIASNVRSYCAIPVVVNGEVTHVLEFFSTVAVPYNEMQIQLLEHTTIQVARVIERCEARRELEKKQEELKASSRLAGLGLLSSGIAHEINNPLTIIAVTTDLLISDLEDNIVDVPRIVGNLRKIRATTDRMTKVINGLRSLSRDSAHDPFTSVTFNILLEETLGMVFENFQNSGVSFRTELLSDPVVVECRSSQISQVITNLMSNAVYAVSDLDSKWVSLVVTETEKMIEVSVTDSGKGIPDHIRGRIFDAFFTTKGVGKGTGLGLSISKSIVDSHNGELFLDQQCPYTRFVMRLPKKQARG